MSRMVTVLALGIVLGWGGQVVAQWGAGAAEGLRQWEASQRGETTPSAPLSSGTSCTAQAMNQAFTGWNGRDTLVPLRNGMVFGQIDTQIETAYTTSPKVLLYQDGFQTKLHIVGTRVHVAVQRLR